MSHEVSVPFRTERPASLAIFLMARPMGDRHNCFPAPNKTRAGPTVRVNGFHSKEVGDEALRVIK